MSPLAGDISNRFTERESSDVCVGMYNVTSISTMHTMHLKMSSEGVSHVKWSYHSKKRKENRKQSPG